MRLKNKVAIVTGGGRALEKRLPYALRRNVMRLW